MADMKDTMFYTTVTIAYIIGLITDKEFRKSNVPLYFGVAYIINLIIAIIL